MRRFVDLCVRLCSKRSSLLAMAAWGLAAGAPFPAGAAPVIQDTFESDPVGQQPANWTITGPNATTITANVASETGPNQFLALRDSQSTGNISTSRSLVSAGYASGYTSGRLEFDIRFNEGLNAQLNLILYDASFQPIALQWHHSSNNTANPLQFRSKGNSQNTYLTNVAAGPNYNPFPIGSWQRIVIDFNANPSGSPRGKYTVTWNGTTVTSDYLDQGANNQTPDRLVTNISGSATTESVDIDNVTITVPEPSGSLLLLGLAAGMGAARRRRR